MVEWTGEVKSRLSPTWPESVGEHNYGCVGTVDSALWIGPVQTWKIHNFCAENGWGWEGGGGRIS